MKQMLFLFITLAMGLISKVYSQKCTSCMLASKSRIFIGANLGLTDQNNKHLENPTYIFDGRIGYFVGKKLAVQTNINSFSRTTLTSGDKVQTVIEPYQSVGIFLRYHFAANRCGDLFIYTGYSIGAFKRNNEREMLNRFTIGGVGYLMKLYKNVNLEISADFNKDNLYTSINGQGRIGVSYFIR